MLVFEELSSIFINYIAKLVNQVTTRVDSAAQIINEVSILISQWDDITLGVLIELTDGVNDVESPSVVVEQLWQISICGSLVLIKFLAIVIIDDISSLGGINSVTTTAYFRSSLIDESTLRVFLDNWETVFIIFKITTDLMRVEVVLFNVERSWKLTLIVEFLLIKHFVTVEIVDNITSSGIGEVTSLIGWLSIFIQELASLFILISKDITLFISIEITDNIALIESSGLSIWWHFDKALLTEVLEGIALHHHT